MKLFDIPSNWQWSKVNRLGSKQRPAVKAGPFGSSLKKEFYVSSGYRIYGQEQVIGNDLSIGNYYIDEERFKSLKSCEVKAGDILVSLVGTFGKILVVPEIFEPGIINPRLVRLSLDSQKIDPHFFSYFFQSPLVKSQLELQSHGGTMGILNAKNVSDLDVPLPPLKEQKRIAAILDKADQVRRKRQKAIRLTEELGRSIFLDMFGDPVTNPKGWIIQSLGKLCTIVRGGSPRPINDYLGGTVPWIKIGDATKGDDIFIHKTAEAIKLEGVKRSRYLEPGSLIFANCGVSLGFARILKIGGCIHDGWLAFSELDSSIDQIFLLKSLNQMTQHFRLIAPDGTQPNLNTTIMKDFKIPIPPINLQKKFVSMINISMLSQQKQIELLEESENLFNSLLQRAFRGEL